VFDRRHIVLLGSDTRDTYRLYLLDQTDFVITQQRSVNRPVRRDALMDIRSAGILVNVDPESAVAGNVVLALGRDLFRVEQDLSLTQIHTAVRPIEKILVGNEDDIILLGESHIEMVNEQRGVWEIWWDRQDDPAGHVFRNLPYAPAVFFRNTIVIGDRQALKRFTPPE
jgi:hypothetical protein